MGTLVLWLLLVSVTEASTPTPTPVSLETTNELLQFSGKPGDDAQTYHLLDTQNRAMESRTMGAMDQQDSINSGQTRAQQMVELLKKEELQKAFGSLNAQGKQMLQENPDMKNPLAIVAGATSLWIGRTVALIKAESFKLSSRIEARARTGEFNMESPIMNGKLSFTGGTGMSMSVNRKIDSIDSRAEMTYSPQNQVFTGQFVHPLSPHFDLQFGASQLQQTNQTDQRASIQYHLSF